MNGYPRFDLTGQVALVTAAARGLGRAISLALADAGADIALGLRDVMSGGELAEQIRAMGRQVLPLQMDMTCMEQIFRAVDDVAAHFGKIDILVNNAGIAPENLAENVREEDFDQTLTINLKGTFFASQAAGRLMIRQKYGRIVNMSSQAGFSMLMAADWVSRAASAVVKFAKPNVNRLRDIAKVDCPVAQAERNPYCAAEQKLRNFRPAYPI